MGHPEIENVRQGKFFEVEVADRLSPEEATSVMKKIAEEVLSNPVIEEYRVENRRLAGIAPGRTSTTSRGVRSDLGGAYVWNYRLRRAP